MSKLIILDANVIICAFKAGLWKTLISRYEIILPEIIIAEAQFYFTSDNSKVHIDLTLDITKGDVKLVQPTPEDVENLCSGFKSDFVNSIDPGELHALSFLKAHALEGYRFCTGDTPAIKAAAIIGLTDSMVSLEELIFECGLKGKVKQLDHNYKKPALQRKLGEGLRDRDMHVEEKSK